MAEASPRMGPTTGVRRASSTHSTAMLPGNQYRRDGILNLKTCLTLYRKKKGLSKSQAETSGAQGAPVHHSEAPANCSAFRMHESVPFPTSTGVEETGKSGLIPTPSKSEPSGKRSTVA